MSKNDSLARKTTAKKKEDPQESSTKI